MLRRKLTQNVGEPDHGDIKRSKLEVNVKAGNVDNSSPNTSKYFSTQDITISDFQNQFFSIQHALNLELKDLSFSSPVAYIYNPVEYAFKGNESYVLKYCKTPKKVLFVGMNPGPFGMVQTGVPFGEIKSVRDWLDINVEIGKPENECPKRPVLGFACTRTEVSGDRFWNLCKKLCGTPEVFFQHCFVFNYCPLALLKNDGNNLTPRDIKDHKKLEDICDLSYFKIIQLLQPEIIIGIGEYAEKRTLLVLKSNNLLEKIKVLRLPHPSPRAVNNQNWPEKAEAFFKSNDLVKYFN